jgi:O-antigen/teichoic acid export membrane protein
VYDRALRLLAAVSVPLAVVLCLLAGPFLTVWAGPVFGRESVLPLYILTVGTVIDGLSYIPRAFLNALNRPDLAARLQLIDVVPYLVVALILTRHYGAPGAAVAWTLRATSDCAVMVFLARRCAGTAAVPSTILRFVPAIAALAAPCALLLFFQPSPLVGLSVTGGSFVAYGGLMWTQVLTGEERAWVGTLFRTWRPFLRDHV